MGGAFGIPGLRRASGPAYAGSSTAVAIRSHGRQITDPIALGVVVERDRGSLPFALLHGEPLVACAAWAMGEAGVQLLDLTTPWEDVREAGMALVWHDVLCPMTPPEFLAACVRRAVADGVVVAGVLPVTDTVKELVEEPDGPGRRRDVRPRGAAPAGVAAGAARGRGAPLSTEWPATDLARGAGRAQARHEVVLLEAPAAAARVHDARRWPRSRRSPRR